MHWFFDYPWGPALTWLVVIAVAAVLAVSFWTIRREIRSVWGLSVIALRVVALVIVVLLLLQPQTKFITSTALKSYTGVLIDTSRSMSITDSGKTVQRLEQAKKVLESENGGGLLPKLREKGNVRLFQFSRKLAELPPKGVSALEKASGDSTAIGAAISEAVEKFGGDDLTSLVLLTDGQDNWGQSPMDVIKTQDVPIFVVGIGEKKEGGEREDKDFAIENVDYDKRVVAGRTTDIVVTVSSMGFPKRMLTASLYKEDEKVPVDEHTFNMNKDDKTTVTMKYTPMVPGKYIYKVSVPVEPGELDDQNNTRMFSVHVVDAINRVLYLEDAPRDESKFLNNVLSVNKNLDLLSFIQPTVDLLLLQGGMKTGVQSGPPLENIEGFKVIIIGNVSSSFFTNRQLERLAKYVEDGGSIVLLGGRSSFGAEGFQNTPLARVLPITPSAGDKVVEEDHKVTTTMEGAAHPVFQEIDIDWSLAPELKTLVKANGMKPGATPLLVTNDDQPVVVVQRYGQGKSAVVLTTSTWHWKLGQATTNLPIDLYSYFWNSLVEWLLPEDTQARKAKAVELMTDKDDYEYQEQVHLIVSVTDADGGLADDAVVRCEVETPDKKVQTLQAHMGDISAYSSTVKEGYTTSFTPHVSGKYVITAIAERGGQEIGREQVSIIVGNPALEFRKTEINEEMLRELAIRSGGGYYRPEEADTIAENISWEEKFVSKTEKEEVWNQWWVLVAFIVLMTSEWIVRKNRQLA